MELSSLFPACGQSDTFVSWQREEDMGPSVLEGKRDWELGGDYLPETGTCLKTKSTEDHQKPFTWTWKTIFEPHTKIINFFFLLLHFIYCTGNRTLGPYTFQTSTPLLSNIPSPLLFWDTVLLPSFLWGPLIGLNRQSWIMQPQPPKSLGLQACITTPGWMCFE